MVDVKYLQTYGNVHAERHQAVFSLCLGLVLEPGVDLVKEGCSLGFGLILVRSLAVRQQTE